MLFHYFLCYSKAQAVALYLAAGGVSTINPSKILVKSSGESLPWCCSWESKTPLPSHWEAKFYMHPALLYLMALESGCPEPFSACFVPHNFHGNITKIDTEGKPAPSISLLYSSEMSSKNVVTSINSKTYWSFPSSSSEYSVMWSTRFSRLQSWRKWCEGIEAAFPQCPQCRPEGSV